MPRTKYQQPTEVNIPTVTASTRGNEALKILRKFGVVIIPLNTITTAERDAALNATQLYSNANRVFKKSENVAEPTMEMKKDPRKFKAPKVPDATQGMIKQRKNGLLPVRPGRCRPVGSQAARWRAHPVPTDRCGARCSIGVACESPTAAQLALCSLGNLGRRARAERGWARDDAPVDQKGAFAIRTATATRTATCRSFTRTC